MDSAVVPLPLDPEVEAGAARDRGDRDRAITILVRAYGRAVRRHCQQILGDRDLADDVQQTVFVEAYRDLERFEARSSFRTWLFAIARHRCLDALKVGARRRERFVRAEPLPEATDDRAAADDALAAGAERRALSEALARLPDDVRVAVQLRHLEGMSYEEIGAVCGARPATVQARVARALPRLRASLALALALVAVVVAAIAGVGRRGPSGSSRDAQVAPATRYQRDLERTVAELQALIAQQGALIESLRQASDDASRERVEAALAAKVAEIRNKDRSLMKLKSSGKARTKGPDDAKRRDESIKVACDPNDPLCGI